MIPSSLAADMMFCFLREKTQLLGCCKREAAAAAVSILLSLPLSYLFAVVAVCGYVCLFVFGCCCASSCGMSHCTADTACVLAGTADTALHHTSHIGKAMAAESEACRCWLHMDRATQQAA